MGTGTGAIVPAGIEEIDVTTDAGHMVNSVQASTYIVHFRKGGTFAEAVIAVGIYILGNVYLLQSGAAIKCVGSNGVYVGAQDYGFHTGQCERPAFHCGNAHRNDNLFQRGAVIECVGTDGGQGVGELNAWQLFALIEGAGADFPQAAAQVTGFKTCTTTERIFADGFNTIGQGDLFQFSVLIEGILADGNGALFNLHRIFHCTLIATGYFTQVDHTIRVIIIEAGVIYCVITHFFYLIANDNFIESSTVYKGTVRNIVCICNGDAFQAGGDTVEILDSGVGIDVILVSTAAAICQ